jgi:hypothetical protein
MYLFVRLCLVGLLAFVQYGNARGIEEDIPSCLDEGFYRMYNLDFAGAHRSFEAWQEMHPEDPLGYASNAAAHLFSEFERLQVLQLDLFTDNKRLKDAGRMSPDPDTKRAFEIELAKAEQISRRLLDESAGDRNALFAKVLADGLRGNYAALVEKQEGAGLELLKSSRVTAEKLIKIDPAYHDAYLAIGIENYLLGLRSAPTRWLLKLSGAQTSKDKGIAHLAITAQKGRYLAPYARLLLAIAALRNRDKKTAERLLAALSHDFPHNRLYRAELARLKG